MDQSGPGYSPWVWRSQSYNWAAALPACALNIYSKHHHICQPLVLPGLRCTTPEKCKVVESMEVATGAPSHDSPETVASSRWQLPSFQLVVCYVSQAHLVFDTVLSYLVLLHAEEDLPEEALRANWGCWQTSQLAPLPGIPATMHL